MQKEQLNTVAFSPPFVLRCFQKSYCSTELLKQLLKQEMALAQFAYCTHLPLCI